MIFANKKTKTAKNILNKQVSTTKILTADISSYNRFAYITILK